MWKQLSVGLRMTITLTVLTGLLYPGGVTGICQVLFPSQANGSLIVRNGKVIGSALIGQNFTRPEYFQPRPSSAGSDGYDASSSAASNLGPTSQKLADRVKSGIEQFRKNNREFTGPVPADLVTASGSGLDPHLSPASIEAQMPRVASARGVNPRGIRQLAAEFMEGRDLGFMGERRINVLRLNLALDERFPVHH
jgi:potassium-transporting ATPase KdpC subunit